MSSTCTKREKDLEQTFTVLLFVGAALLFFYPPQASYNKAQPQKEVELAEDGKQGVPEGPVKMCNPSAIPRMAALILIGIVTLGINLKRILRAVGGYIKSEPADEAGWGIYSCLKIIVFLIVSMTLMRHVFPELSNLQTFMLSEILTLLYGLCLFRIFGGKEMFSTRGSHPNSTLLAVKSYLCVLPIVVFANLLCFFVMLPIMKHSFGYEPQQMQNAIKLLSDPNLPTATLYIFIAFIAIVGPIIEEVFFRGFLYGTLRNVMGILPAALISGFCFAVIHGDFMQMLGLWVLGITLALIKEKGGSLLAPCLLHIINNSVMLSMVLI